jgi:DNA-binding sugar fermentation-stimulating protein
LESSVDLRQNINAFNAGRVTTRWKEYNAENFLKVRERKKSKKCERSAPSPSAMALSPHSSGTVLMQLGSVMRMGVISRPSVAIKSPYVADLRQNPFDFSPFAAILDAPASPVKEGKSPSKTALKKERKEKLDALVADLSSGGTELAHAPSLDCAGMVVAGSNCFATKNTGMTTKTGWTIQLCEEERGSAEPKVIVGYHPALAEKLAKSILQQGLLKAELGAIEKIASQRTFGNSRVDYVLECEDNSLALVEVKNVVGAEYEENTVPAERSPVGVYTVSKEDLPGPGQRHAIFPHGSVKPGIGVVSDRAIKHVTELTQLHGSKDKETGRTIKSVVLFIINRSDTTAFRPAHEACPLFAQCLLKAQQSGVALLAREIVWTLDGGGGGDGGKEMASSEGGENRDNNEAQAEARIGKALPVLFHTSVTADIDEDHLQRVLRYNAEVPKTRSPPPKSKSSSSSRGEEEEGREMEGESPNKKSKKNKKTGTKED